MDQYSTEYNIILNISKYRTDSDYSIVRTSVTSITLIAANCPVFVCRPYNTITIIL